MQIKPLIALYPKVSLIGSPNTFCREAKNQFNHYLESGFYKHNPEPAFFVLQIENGAHRHTGLVGLNHVQDFLDGHIKKHEKTLSERELKHKELFLRWKAVLKPVLLAYDPVTELQEWLVNYSHEHHPVLTVHLKKAEMTHRFWAITSTADIAFLQNIFSEKIRDTYIADGHHRSSTTARLFHDSSFASSGLDMNHLFCAWFSSDQLDILDYNRVVEGVKKIGAGRLMAKLSRLFEIECLDAPRKPHEKHEIVMYLQKEWYALRWRKSVLEVAEDGYDTLDTDLINDLVINQIFKIKDVRTDTRIGYVEGSKGLEGVQSLANRKKNDNVGFVFHPVSFSDMKRLADAGKSLPPKSTYFEPRLKSGLLVRMLDPNMLP
ncbi:MAG: DUF1015 family protein [Saprospiraceae bacterium]